jgi:hypothetical protein
LDEESAAHFASLGATVLKMACNDTLAMTRFELPRGEVSWSIFAGPFLILVDYHYEASDIIRNKSGRCLVLNFFGYTKILQKDSSLYRRMTPYLWPY